MGLATAPHSAAQHSTAVATVRAVAAATTTATSSSKQQQQSDSLFAGDAMPLLLRLKLLWEARARGAKRKGDEAGRVAAREALDEVWRRARMRFSGRTTPETRPLQVRSSIFRLILREKGWREKAKKRKAHRVWVLLIGN